MAKNGFHWHNKKEAEPYLSRINKALKMLRYEGLSYEPAS